MASPDDAAALEQVIERYNEAWNDQDLDMPDRFDFDIGRQSGIQLGHIRVVVEKDLGPIDLRAGR